MSDRYEDIPLAQLHPSPYNRRRFDESKMRELAESIRQKGIAQTLVVRRIADAEGYEIVCGERRYRAGLMAEIETAPCRIMDLSDEDALELNVIENTQREDVHPVEQFEGYRRLIDSGKYGKGFEATKALAAKLGMSTSHVYDRLALAKLSDEAREELLAGPITMGHATELVKLKEKDQAEALTFCLWLTSWDGKKQARTSERRESPASVRDLREWIARNISCDLAKANFDVRDDSLLRMVGACGPCPKRTNADNPDAPLEAQQCLDRDCFTKKREAHQQRRLSEVLSMDPTVPKLSASYSPRGKEVIGKSDYTVVEPGTPGAVVAVYVHKESYDKEEIGETVYVKLKKSQEARANEAANKEESERKLKIERTRRALTFDAALQLSLDQDFPELGFHRTLLRRVATRMVKGGGFYESHAEKVCRRLDIPKGNYYSISLCDYIKTCEPQLLTRVFVGIITAHELEDYCNGERQLDEIAEELGVDLELLRREAEEKHAPKAPKLPKTPKLEAPKVVIHPGTNVVLRDSARRHAIEEIKRSTHKTLDSLLSSEMYTGGPTGPDFAIKNRFDQKLGHGRCAVTYKDGEQYIFTLRELAEEAGLQTSGKAKKTPEGVGV